MATAAQLLIEVGAQTKTAESDLNRMGGVVQRLGGFMANAISTAAGFVIAQPIINALSGAFSFAQDAAIGFNSQLQQAQIGFETMLGSGKKAQDFLQQLANFAVKTPFQMSGLLSSSQQLLAFGFDAKDILPTLTALGDAMSGLGKTGSSDLYPVILALGQMKAKGHLASQEMNQLAEQGIPSWKILADAMHLSVAQLQDLVTKGAIPADKAVKLLTDGIEKRFHGLMSKQATTFQGAMSNIHDAAQQVIATGFKPLFDVLTQGANKVADFLMSSDFKTWANNASTWLGGVIKDVGGGLVDAFQKASYWFDKARGVWDDLTRDLARGQGPIGLIASIFHKLGETEMLFVRDGLQNIRDGVKAVQPQLKLFGDNAKRAYDILASFGAWVESTLLPDVDQAEAKFSTWGNTMSTKVAPALLDVLANGQKLGNVITDDLVKPIAEKLLPALIGFGAWLFGIGSELGSKIAPDLKGAGDAVGSFADKLDTRLGPAVSRIMTTLQDWHDNLMPLWDAMWPKAQAVAQGAWDVITGIVEFAWSIISNTVLIGLDLISGKSQLVLGDMQNLYQGAWDGIKRIVGGVFEATVGQYATDLGKLKDNTIGKLGDVTGEFGKLGGRIQKAIASIPSILRGNVNGWFDAMIAAVFNGEDRLATAFRQAMAEATSAFPFPHIPGFASGTRDAPGGLAYVHRDELVYLPQHSQVYTKGETRAMLNGSRSLSAGGGGGDVHLHFAAGAIVTQAKDGKQLLAELSQEAEYQRRAHGS